MTRLRTFPSFYNNNGCTEVHANEEIEGGYVFSSH